MVSFNPLKIELPRGKHYAMHDSRKQHSDRIMGLQSMGMTSKEIGDALKIKVESITSLVCQRKKMMREYPNMFNLINTSHPWYAEMYAKYHDSEIVHNANARITVDQVRKIKTLAKENFGIDAGEIVRKLQEIGIIASYNTVYYILIGQTWKHIKI